jgi:D-lactate dehydrogenase
MQKMLTPHVRAIGRPPGPAQDDAVDPGQVEGTTAALKNDPIQLMGKEQVLHRISDLVRYASDASPYRYLPQVVVLPRTIDDVRAILDYCARTGRHTTFRAGGTSMNGQSQSDDILIDVRRHWAGMVAEDGGARLRARPGTILGHANAVLRPLGRRLGPDPASADVATIGGVIANNAGDRGLLHPEPVISATRDEKAGLDETPAQAYLSANRTCEMGLRQATGRPYESFVFLLEELTRP